MSSLILVIGALGNAGTEITKQLQASGQAVRAADINTDRLKERYGNSVESVHFDFYAPETYPAALKGIKRIFLMRPPHMSNVKRDMRPFIEAAQKAGVKQVVFLSILGADKIRIVPHYSVERMLMASSMDYVFLRSAYFMQNLSGIHAQEIRAQKKIFIPAGQGELGMIDIRDVGAIGATALVEGHRNQAYSLTGERALSFTQAADEFSQVLGHHIQYDDPHVLKFFSHMRSRNLPTGLITFMIIEYTNIKLGRSGAITNDAEKILGRKPISFRRFVKDYKDVWL